MPQFTIPLEGGGEMRVNASSQAAAEANVQSTGNTPASSGGGGGGGDGGTPQFSAANSPAAADGQTLAGQSAQTQNDYASVYGANAATQWAADHNAAIGQAGTPVTPGAPAAPATPAAPAAPTLPGAAAPATTSNDALAKFFSQTSGITQAQLAQQKAEFDAQLAFARQQMEQLGIPQLQINQYLAALQQQQFQATLAQNAAALTGYYVAPNLPTLSPTGGANQPQATQGTGQGVQTLASILQQAQLSGMYQGAPTEAAREFNAQNALAQGQLGQQYLSTAAQLQGPQNTFQLSNYLRGAQGNPNVPTYLQALANNMGLPAFQATGTTAPTPQSAAGIAGQLGGSQSATPGWDYNQTLGAIQNIMSRGAQGLGPGSIERLTPDELAALGSGLGAVGGSLPAFLQQYAQSRVGQTAPTAMTALA